MLCARGQTTNKEHVAICFRWDDNKLEAHEEFIGLYNVESTQQVSYFTSYMTSYNDRI